MSGYKRRPACVEDVIFTEGPVRINTSEMKDNGAVADKGRNQPQIPLTASWLQVPKEE